MVLLGALIMPAFQGCEKYEDGPTISLAFKKSRVANTWKVENTYTNGTVDQCDALCQDFRDNITVEYTKDGKVISKYKFGNASIETPGEWQFNDDKTQIGVKMEGETTYEYSTILRLTSKEMWTEDTTSIVGVTIRFETHYVSDE